MTSRELLRLSITGEPDVFTVRQRGREVAEAIGLDAQDQVRVATALSDVGRDLVRAGVPAAVVFALTSQGRSALDIEFSWQGPPPGEVLKVGRGTAARLMDDLRATHSGTTAQVVMSKATGAFLPKAVVDSLRDRLAASGVVNPLDELRAHNQELLGTLGDLEAKQQELLRLNAELEETNQGVVALYKELSEELEETNRGVVALYAELNEKTTQLAAVNDAQTRFWSNVSHELRSPVNSIVGLARMLASPETGPLTPDQARQVRLIDESGATLLAMINELLDTAKAESGRLVPQFAPVDLRALFLQLKGALRSTVPSAAVELRIDDKPEVEAIVTDETMLTRILRNLLSNGLKFTERGEVRLAVQPDHGHVRFVVTDTGIGIPPDQHERVFEEFHQVPGALQARAGGTGLGLPYARRLTEILGGELTLDSEPGRGTTVELRLPVEAPGRDITRLGTVLLVDDDPGFRRLFAGRIAELAGDIRHASDGREALDILTELRPDVVFLDLAMPGMQGREVLTVLRDKPGSRDLPVVVLTSAVPDGLDLTGSGLRAALLLKSQISAETIRLAVGEAFAVARRTVPR
ncbi:ATP-binding protein [Amycolatopsis sp. NPDC051372]|uniref:ATP-binding response regulator n=1 Tax=unclassified Amycolatopsis TaxID=2618356 RepID=UPI003417C0CB